MVGIYKITNKANGKIYIGQSTNIMYRWNQHYLNSFSNKEKKHNLLHKAFRKYGIQNFYFEIEELCDKDQLNEKEIEYIKLYNSLSPNGYNLTPGGNQTSLINENNPRSKITQEDVYNIREDYKNLLTKKETYEKYKDKISYNTFSDVWVGKTWVNIHYDVYTEKNKMLQRNNYDRFAAASKNSQVSQEDIILIRNLKNQLECKKEVHDNYFPHMNIHIFDDIWYYRTFQYISPTVELAKGKRRRPFHEQDGTKNPAAIFTEEQVKNIRQKKKDGVEMKEIYTAEYQDTCTIETFKRLWNGETYKDIIV